MTPLEVSDAIWTNDQRKLMSGTAATSTTLVGHIADAMWTYAYRTLSAALANHVIIDAHNSLMAKEFDQMELAISSAEIGESDPFELQGSFSRLYIAVTNVGADALTTMVIEAQAHPDGAWFTLVSAAELHAGTASGQLILAIGDLSVLAAAATASVSIDVRGLYAIRLKATTAGFALLDILGTAAAVD